MDGPVQLFAWAHQYSGNHRDRIGAWWSWACHSYALNLGISSHLIHELGGHATFHFGYRWTAHLAWIFSTHGWRVRGMGSLDIGAKSCNRFTDSWVMGSRFAVVMVSDSPWAIPLAFIAGGVLAVLLSSKQSEHGNVIAVRLPVPWGSVALFFGLLFIGLLGPYFWGSSLIETFERFYRYGYQVFGGGQEVDPCMQGELVTTAGLMSQDEFLAGFGLVQALPGPMFSFAAYAGGLCEQGGGMTHQFLGAMIGGWAIFLPGTLLLFFVYPFGEELNKFHGSIVPGWG